MSQTKEKQDSLVLSRGDFWMIWRCHGLPCFHIYFLFHSYVQSSFWTITKHLGNSIWKTPSGMRNLHRYMDFHVFWFQLHMEGGGAWMERCVNINPKDKLKEETSYDKEVVIYLKDSIRKVICLYTYNKH